jgi:hypothetical protein
MAAGFNRLNHLSVVQATQGLAAHALTATADAQAKGVVVGCERAGTLLNHWVTSFDSSLTCSLSGFSPRWLRSQALAGACSTYF